MARCSGTCHIGGGRGPCIKVDLERGHRTFTMKKSSVTTNDPDNNTSNCLHCPMVSTSAASVLATASRRRSIGVPATRRSW